MMNFDWCSHDDVQQLEKLRIDWRSLVPASRCSERDATRWRSHAIGMMRTSIETHKPIARQLNLNPQRRRRFKFVPILTFYRPEAIEAGTLDIKI